MFVCTKCGLCCRNIDKIPALANFHTGDGVCIHLTVDNLCEIYADRPAICNVNKMYDLFYRGSMPKTEYEKLNIEGCKALQNRQ